MHSFDYLCGLGFLPFLPAVKRESMSEEKIMEHKEIQSIKRIKAKTGKMLILQYD